MSIPLAENELQTTAPDPATTFRRPNYDVSELDDHYEIRVLMPGVSKDGVSVSLHGRHLEVAGTRSQTPAEDWRPILRELDWNDYKLNLELNVDVNEGAIDASVSDGLLNLTLPKPEEQKPRSIPIQ
ncbi:MAG: Hsp20/alpha crystallin family protein [Verrucomicrobiota bacterium]